MSALGQKQTCAVQNGMSALPPKADMCGALGDVRFVPIADIAPLQEALFDTLAVVVGCACGLVPQLTGLVAIRRMQRDPALGLVAARHDAIEVAAL